MNRKTDLNNFIVEDGQYLRRWDVSAPLFDHFFILGPESFDPTCKPSCLFSYPNNEAQIKCQNENEISKLQLEVKIKQDIDKLTQFFFPDGIHFVENDKSHITFSKQPKPYDNIIFIKSEGSTPHYYYGIRFRCSPYTRPSALLSNDFLQFFNNEKDKNNDFIECEKLTYLTNMKIHFEKEIISYCESRCCPTCLFAYVFETQHPFIELFYNLIHQIAFLETYEKSKSCNLDKFLRSCFIQKPEDIKNQYKNDDDFIIVNKIDGSKQSNAFDCIISMKEFDSNESTKNEESNVCLQQNNSIRDDVIISDNNSIEEDMVLSNEVLDILCLEKAFDSHNNFLKTLLANKIFTSVGEKAIIHTGDPSCSKFLWQIPSIFQSCRNMIIYGIVPLLEWISLNDFIRILSLLFLEVSVIVIGTNIESIVRVVTAFPHIVFPFAWSFPIMTIIPDSFVDILGSPIPFIAGVFLNEACIKKICNLDDFNDILVIDMENQIIKWPKMKYPIIASENEYINSLSKYCKTTKHIPISKSLRLNNISKSDIVIVPNQVQKKKKINFELNYIFNKFKSLSIIQKCIHHQKNEIKDDLFFNLDRIDDIVDSILNTTQNVFVSKILPAMVTRVIIDDNGKKEIGSMLINELYYMQFSDKEKSFPFLDFFMKTQMFVSYREHECKLKTDFESGLQNYI